MAAERHGHIEWMSRFVITLRATRYVSSRRTTYLDIYLTLGDVEWPAYWTLVYEARLHLRRTAI